MGDSSKQGEMRFPPAAPNLRWELLLLPAMWVTEVFVLWVRMQHLDTVNGRALVLFSILIYLPMLWCRQQPLAALCAVVFGSAVISAHAPGFHPTLCMLLTLFLAAAQGVRTYAFLALVVSLGAAGLNVADLAGHAPGHGDRLVIVVLGGVFLLLAEAAAFGFGRWVQWSDLDRERTARVAAARAEAQERRRITRELHDVVAHAVSIMTLQAAGAARTMTSDPEKARTALQHVTELGEQATLELSAMLSYLSPDQEPQDSTITAWRLQDVGRVVEQVRRAGRDVVVSCRGQARSIDPAADEAAYRIVQEALTNAVKYADPHRPVRLDVIWGLNTVEVSISTDGIASARHGLPALSTCCGIRGMRERAHAVGGDLSAAPTPAGGFGVCATIPLAGRPAVHAQRARSMSPAPLAVPR